MIETEVRITSDFDPRARRHGRADIRPKSLLVNSQRVLLYAAKHYRNCVNNHFQDEYDAEIIENISLREILSSIKPTNPNVNQVLNIII